MGIFNDLLEAFNSVTSWLYDAARPTPVPTLPPAKALAKALAKPTTTPAVSVEGVLSFLRLLSPLIVIMSIILFFRVCAYIGDRKERMNADRIAVEAVTEPTEEVTEETVVEPIVEPVAEHVDQNANASSPPPDPSSRHSSRYRHSNEWLIRSYGQSLNRSIGCVLITQYGMRYHRSSHCANPNGRTTYAWIPLDVALREGFCPCQSCARGFPVPDIERHPFRYRGKRYRLW